MVRANQQRGTGSGEGTSPEHRNRGNESDNPERLDNDSNRASEATARGTRKPAGKPGQVEQQSDVESTKPKEQLEQKSEAQPDQKPEAQPEEKDPFEEAPWREAAKDQANKLIAAFSKNRKLITEHEFQGDEAAKVELDKLIIGTMDKLIAKGLKSPAAALTVAFFYMESENEPTEEKDWARRIVSFRVADTAALLSQFRWWKRMLDSGIDPDTPLGQPLSLAEYHRGALEPRATVGQRHDFCRRELAMRGLIKQHKKSKTADGQESS